jgi:hypothetical protein
MKIYPSPKLHPTEYIPGLGEAGAEFPTEQAEDMIARGLAVKSKPKPAAPAEKSEDQE